MVRPRLYEGQTCARCDRAAVVKGLCHKHYTFDYYQARPRKTDTLPPTDNYQTAHDRVKRAFGRAHNYDCVGDSPECLWEARDWALKADAVNVLYGYGRKAYMATAAFSNDVNDYQPMCQPCHRAYDAEHGHIAYRLEEKDPKAFWKAHGFGYESE